MSPGRVITNGSDYRSGKYVFSGAIQGFLMLSGARGIRVIVVASGGKFMMGADHLIFTVSSSIGFINPN